MKNSNPSNQALWKTRILKIIETPAGRTARLLEANLSHILDIAMDHFALIVAHLERAAEQFLPKRYIIISQVIGAP